MAKTVSTNASSYLTPAEAIKRGDWRVFADLCADDGTRIALADLSSNVNFLALLRDASGAVESCCSVGGRYAPADLAALIANSGMGAGILQRLVYRLAVVFAFERRPDREMKQPWIYEQAMADLQALRDGIAIFPFIETQDVGVPTERTETPANVEARNGTSYQLERMLGRRSNRVDRTP